MSEDRTSMGLICDKETATCFRIAGMPLKNEKNEANILMIDDDTTDAMITTFYEELRVRKDICIIFVGIDIVKRIKNFKISYTDFKLPLILKIPTKSSLENNFTKDAYLAELFPKKKKTL